MQAGLQVDTGILKMGSCCLYSVPDKQVDDCCRAAGTPIGSCVWCDARVLCIRCKQLNNQDLSTWLVAAVSVEPVSQANLMIDSKTQEAVPCHVSGFCSFPALLPSSEPRGQPATRPANMAAQLHVMVLLHRKLCNVQE